MPKLTAPELESGYRSVQKLTEFITDVSDALDNTLSRDGTSPNQMEADLDMNSHHITNLPAPTLPGDPIRLQDINADSVVTVGGTVQWDDILGKPSTFPPSSTTVNSITDFQEGVEDTVGAQIVAGTNITAAYDDTTGKVTISAVAPPTGSVDWADITSKPSTFPSTAHTHNESEIVSLVSDLSNKSNVGHTHVAANITDFTEAAQDAVAASLVAGTNMASIVYNDASNTITFNAATQSSAGVPMNYVGANENGITTGTAASTNTSLLNNLIASMASSGGTIWFNQAGPYQINGTINLKSNVSIRMVSGALFSWVGSASGTIFETDVSTVHTGTHHDLFVNEGASFTGVVLRMHSAYRNTWNLVGFGTQTASGKFMYLSANSTGNGPFTERNLAFNTVRAIHLGTCGYFLQMDGTTSGGPGGNPQVCTLNNFVDLQAVNCLWRGIKLDSWTDTNEFSGQQRFNMTGANSGGVIVNEGRGVAGVYNNHWTHLAVDTFGSGLNRFGVKLFESKGHTCDAFYQLPLAEQFDINGTEATSYQFRWLKSDDTIVYRQKGIGTPTL